MNIAGLSTSLAQNQVQTDFGVAMLSKSMDLSSTMGEGLTQMMDAASLERSAQPYLGSNFDMSV